MIGTGTRTAWVLGSPVAHSLSPAMHNAAYRAMGLDAVYLAARVEPDHLEDALRGLRALGALGCNLTLPLKEVGALSCHRLEGPAAALGAVNTVCFQEAQAVGHNTDGEGWLRSWDEEVAEPLAGRRVVLLGAGGAARALFWAVSSRGPRDVVVLNRDPERAQRLVEDLARPGVEAGAAPLEGLGPWLEPGVVVVNATPAGMAPRTEATPVEWPRSLPPGVVACDLVYTPRTTRFLAEAARRGARTLGGLGMLVHQAAAAIELWTGRTPPVAEMRRAVPD